MQSVDTLHLTVLSVPHLDERDWSALTHGDRVRQLEVEGYVVLPNLLSPEHIARLKLETRQLPTTAVDYSVHQRVYSHPQFAGRAIAELAAFPPTSTLQSRLIRRRMFLACDSQVDGHAGGTGKTAVDKNGRLLGGFEIAATPCGRL